MLAFNAGQPFMQYKLGDVVTDASQMKQPLTGPIYLALANDNLIEPIDVNVKVTAIQLNQVWETRIVNHMSVISSQVPYLMN
jgi:hypothetical protein